MEKKSSPNITITSKKRFVSMSTKSWNSGCVLVLFLLINFAFQLKPINPCLLFTKNEAIYAQIAVDDVGVEHLVKASNASGGFGLSNDSNKTK